MSKAVFFPVATLVLTSALSVEAQTASGSFDLEPGGSFSPKVAAAFVVRDKFDPRQKLVEIVLSAARVDVAAAVADLDPDGVVINDAAVKNGDFVRVWIHGDGNVSMNAKLGKIQFAENTREPGNLKAELEANTPEKVAGRIFTDKAVKVLDGSSYRVNLAFSAPITRPPAGTALPAGGGEPGKALTAFLEAREKRDWPALKVALSPALTEELVKGYNDDQANLSGTLTSLNYWLPVKSILITGGTTTGNSAVLDVEGMMAYETRALSLVRMIKAPSGWLLDRAKRVGMLP